MSRTTLLLALALLAATPVHAAEPPQADRYADGSGFAGKALDELLSRDDGDIVPDAVDPDGPTDCMLRLPGAPVPA